MATNFILEEDASPVLESTEPADLRYHRFRPQMLEAGVLAGIALLLAVCLWQLIEARSWTQRTAEQSGLQVAGALASRITHDIESLSLAVADATSASHLPGVWKLPPDLRKAALFDSAILDKDTSSILIIDADGAVRTSYGVDASSSVNMSHFDFFEYHRRHAEAAGHISGPFVNPINGARELILSRRIADSSGNFAGIVVGGLAVSHFQDLFRQIDLSRGSELALVATVGAYIAREPEDPRTATTDLRKTPLLAHWKQASKGTFIDYSPIDGREMLVAYEAIDGLPLIVFHSRNTVDVFASWRRVVEVIGPALLFLAGFLTLLISGLRRERVRRVSAEQYARISAEALATVNRDLERRIQEEVALREDALEKLAASQRIEALGQLAGGIAHDINNVLQIVAGACSLLRARSQAGDDVDRLTGVSLSAAQRGSAITQRLLVFARRAAIHPEQIDVAVALNDLQELLSHTLAGSVVTQLELADNLPDMLIDRMQFETVMINLATNARDAMPDGGIVTISARVESDIPVTDLSASTAPEQFIRLSVTDTGRGMDKTTLARATEPFFSTKGIGRGTGLGLSMAKGFAEQSKGKFDITSEVGKGTTVTLWFPAVALTKSLDRVPSRADGPKTPSGSEGSRVLIVDDNRQAADLVSEWLMAAGFVIHQAYSGAEALSAIKMGLKVDLLLTDLSMPKMNGIQLIRQVRELFPDLPAIILTGNVNAVADLAIEEGVGGKCLVLHKPIRLSELPDGIKLVLTGRYNSAFGGLLSLGGVLATS